LRAKESKMRIGREIYLSRRPKQNPSKATFYDLQA